MLTAVARHLLIKWLFVFHLFDPFVSYNKSFNDWSLEEQVILFPRITVFPSTSFRDQSLGAVARKYGESYDS